MKKELIATNKLKRVICYATGFAGLRDDDIILSSFPRSGNTWMRFLLCNLISLNEWEGENVNFPLLNRVMPELGANNLLAPWKWNTLPRIVKTHRRYISFFSKSQAIGIVRDPRDVMVSYFHYAYNRKGLFIGSFSEFIRSEKWGLPAWFTHYSSWKEHWMLTIQYEDLKMDTYHELERLLGVLNLKLPPVTLQQAIERSKANRVGQMDLSLLNSKDSARFVRNTSIDQWQDYFNEQDISYFNILAANFDYPF